jgi:hypothetical protein
LAAAAGVAVVFLAVAGFLDLVGLAVPEFKNPKSNSDESGAFGLTPPA